MSCAAGQCSSAAGAVVSLQCCDIQHDPHQLQRVGEQSFLDLPVDHHVCGEAGAMVDFQQPWPVNSLSSDASRLKLGVMGRILQMDLASWASQAPQPASAATGRRCSSQSKLRSHAPAVAYQAMLHGIPAWLSGAKHTKPHAGCSTQHMWVMRSPACMHMPKTDRLSSSMRMS